MTITQVQADALPRNDVQSAVDAINRLVTTEINQAEFNALVDLALNIGIGALASSTLLRDLNDGDFAGASNRFDE